MAGLTEFRRVGEEVRNWGLWCAYYDLGTLKLITPEKL